MLHHYNYSTSLSHFLSYHQLEDQNNDNESGVHATSNVPLCDELSQEDDSRCRRLKNDGKDIQSENEMSVMNLSVHPGSTDRQLMSNCSRLQLPTVHRPVTGHFPAGHPCASAIQTGNKRMQHIVDIGLPTSL
ncbi:unnamed protein product [Brassicogethes aeneus]|uniref:Uncharacterized protein n=1 Tax=Brassicogethes aeneus TaxID=1431903 RepID=A0A9P0B9P0_BRAAE|nr:unnamed protein product [Brassicogethes aeneus]